jgi:hypothetical protein
MKAVRIGMLGAALLASLGGGLAVDGVARAAINPAHYQQVASDRLQVHETARIVAESTHAGHRWRRVTLVGTIVAIHRLPEGHVDAARIGRPITIDYTVDLDAREQAAAAWARENGSMPGPQFLAEPDPPTPDADGNYWAHLAPQGGRLANVNRHAGAVAAFDAGYQARGEVYVPVAAQYSFEPPMD